MAKVLIEKPEDLTLEECQEAFAMYRNQKAQRSGKKRKINDVSEENSRSLDIGHIVNLSVPHIAEQIFENIDSLDLIQCAEVSGLWKVLAEKVLVKRLKSQMFVDACENGKTEVVKTLLNYNHVNLNERKVIVQRDHTPFMIACRNGQRDVVQFLLNNPRSGQIDLNAKDRSGMTAVYHACYAGQTDILRLLLDHPCSNQIDFTLRKKFGYTPFMEACLNGHNDIINLLMNHPRTKRIDFKSDKNKYGGTALHYARKFRQNNTVALLTRYGFTD